MKLYIPEIGDKIMLDEDWDFVPVAERRNESLFQLLMPDHIKNDMVYPIANYSYVYDRDKNNRFIYSSSRKVLKNPDYPENFKISFGELKNYPEEISKHWRFSLDYNKKLLEDFDVVLPKGTELKVDRIYIRKGAGDYSSVTFYIEKHPNFPKLKKKIRFFASLNDVNRISFLVHQANFIKIGKKSSDLLRAKQSFEGRRKPYIDWTGNLYNPPIPDVNLNVYFKDKILFWIKSEVEYHNEVVKYAEPFRNRHNLNALPNGETVNFAVIDDWNLTVVDPNTKDILYKSKDNNKIKDFIQSIFK